MDEIYYMSQASAAAMAKDIMHDAPTIIEESESNEDIMGLFSGQWDVIVESDKKYRAAVKNAKDALTKADEARDLAEIAQSKSAGLGKKRAAIEALQSAGQAQSEATISMANALGSTNEAVEHMYECQKKLSAAAKYLFVLGVLNLASAQSYIERVQAKLDHASKEELSEMARQELENVIAQLKAQVNIMEQQKLLYDVQKGMGADVDELKRNLENVEGIAQTNSEELDKQSEKDEEHDKRLDEGEKHDSEQDKRLDIGDKKDSEQDKRLDAGDKKDSEQDRRLQSGEEKDSEQDQLIRRNLETIETLKAETEELKEQVSGSTSTLKVLAYSSAAAATVSFVLSILNFFL